MSDQSGIEIIDVTAHQEREALCQRLNTKLREKYIALARAMPEGAKIEIMPSED